MKYWLIALVTFIAAAIAAHLIVLHQTPGFIMGKAIDLMEANGVQEHEFSLSPRITPQTQTVVRPSPDLAYSICRFDVAESSLQITAQPWEAYASVSLFDAQTNNFATVRAEEGASFRLLPPGAEPNRDGDIVSPTRTGLILIRRLAPTPEDYDFIKAQSAGDTCAQSS